MMTASVLRIVFDPGGTNELVLLDWLQVGQIPDLGWQQAVQADNLIGADWQAFYPRGNVQRTWSITARRTFATAMQLAYEALDHDADLPIGIKSALHVRVLDLDAASTGNEASRTLAHYIASEAMIASATPRSDAEMMSLDVTYNVQMGRLVKQ